MEVIRYQLENGLKVILQARPTAPVVACNVWVNVGSADEEPHEAGLAHVHEHMLFKGTSRRGVGEIAREVEGAGGHINAFTSFDQTCYYVVMSSRYFETGVDILSDAIRNSAFEADELGRELEVIQEEIKRGNDSPQRVVGQMLFDTAYTTHPYKLPVIGSKESVDSFRREHVVNFFNKHYRPDNTTLVLVGDFTLEAAKEMVIRYFGDWEAGGRVHPKRPQEPAQTAFRGRVESRDIQDNHLRMAFHIPDILHEDIPAIDVLGVVMGAGNASHLYQVLQRERELVNGVYAMAYTPKDDGIFMVGADYQLGEKAKTHEDIMRPLLEEVFRFRHFNVPAEDIERARTQIESEEIYSQQTAEGLAMKLGRGDMVTGDPEFDAKYYAAVARVTPQELRRVAQKYLVPKNLTATLMRSEKGAPEVSVEELQTIAEKAFGLVESHAADVGTIARDGAFASVKFPNGPQLIIQEDHTVPTFAMRALTLGGLRYETQATNGINGLLSELVTAGTKTRSSVDIARTMEGLASGLGGIAGRNSFGMALTGLSRCFDRVFDVFAECLTASTIPDEEFQRERSLQLQNIRSNRDQLGYVNGQQFMRAFFGDYPYSMPVEGSEQSVGSLTAQGARDYLHRLVEPAGLVITAVGDVDADHVAALVEKWFVRTEMAEAHNPQLPPAPIHTSPSLVVGSLDKEQAYVTVGFHAPLMADPLRYAMEVLYAILSGQGGRLFYELRDKQSLAYSVYASMLLGLESSAFTVNIGTSPEKIEQAVGGIYTEIHKLLEGGVTQDELERAKTYLVGNHDIGLQKYGARAMSFALDELYGFGHQKTLEYSDRIASVTQDDIQSFVNRYLKPSHSVVSITKPTAFEVRRDLLESLKLS